MQPHITVVSEDICWYNVQEEDRHPDKSTPFWQGTAAVMRLQFTGRPQRLLSINYSFNLKLE